MSASNKSLNKRARELALQTTLPEICEAILALVERVESLEKKVERMSKKNKEPKIREPKTDTFICNDALYYQSDLIGKQGDIMKVTNNFNGVVDIVFTKTIEGHHKEVAYQVNEVTWKMWVKEVRVVKATPEAS